ncbi:MAG TPA: hypothetical protein VK935_21870 [Actinomycetospora sp.]|nr:hypothetical protein [Actinomycetospora sp.]
MSVLGWVLVGLAAWVVVAVVLALVVGHFVRPDRVTTLDLLRAREGVESPTESAEPPGSPEPATDADLPTPRGGAHDDAAATSRRRR